MAGPRRVACASVMLAIVMAGNCAEAAESYAEDTEVVALTDGAAEDGVLASQLRKLGAQVSKSSMSEVDSVLSRGFTKDVWGQWHKQAATQKLDFEASVAVLNSYLCANVADGSKVMHVISWVKKALQSEPTSVGPSKHEKLVAELRKRASDATQLAKQVKSPAAIQLAHQMHHDLAEALADPKLEKLKAVAAKKKAHAAKLTKQLEAKRAAKSTASAKKRAQKAKARQQKLKKLAAKQQKKAAAAAESAKTAAASVLLAKTQAKKARGKAKAKLEAKAAQTKKVAAQLKSKAKRQKQKAAMAEQKASYKPLSFEYSVASRAKELHAKNSKLLATEKKVLAKAQTEQARLVKEKVAAVEKLHLARSTLLHAKATKDKALVLKAMNLVAAAKKHNRQVSVKVIKAAAALKASGRRLRKLGKEEGRHLAGAVKERIRRTIGAVKFLRKRAHRVVKAQKLKLLRAKRATNAAKKQADSAGVAAEKAFQKAKSEYASAHKLDSKADQTEKLSEPMEDAIDVFTKKVTEAKKALALAKESKQPDAMKLATKQAKDAMTVLNVKTKELKALGPTPIQLRASASHMRALSDKQRVIQKKALSAAKEFAKSEKEAQLAAKASTNEIVNVENLYLPKVLRHAHTRIAHIEHSLATHLDHVKSLAKVQLANPTKIEMLKTKELQKKVAADNAAAKIKLAKLGVLRNHLQKMRMHAEEALKQAKMVDDASHVALTKAAEEKKKACSKIKSLQKQISKLKKSKGDTESLSEDLSDARKACSKAVAAVVTARSKMQSHAKTLAAAAAEAKKMEVKYAAEEKHLAAQRVMVTTKKTVKMKASEILITRKREAVDAMIKQAKGKEARAELMLMAAKKTKNKAGLETATAAKAAALLHLGKLYKEKKALSKKEKKKQQELGELKADIRHVAENIKRVEDEDAQKEVEMGTEQNEALDEEHRYEESQSSTVELRDSLDSQTTDDEAATRRQIRVMADRMRTVHKSTAELVAYMQGFVTKGPIVNSEDANKKVKADIDLANSQLGKLQKLLVTAKKKAETAKAKKGLAQKSGVSKAMQMAVTKEKTADSDILKVREAVRQVRTRRDKDTADLKANAEKAKQGATKEEIISKFSQHVLPKIQKIQEAAAAGLTVRVRDNRLIEMLTDQLSEAGRELEKLLSRQSDLKDKYARAEKRRDNHNMIVYGTEEKDLSVEIDDARGRRNELRGRLKDAKAERRRDVTRDQLELKPQSANAAAGAKNVTSAKVGSEKEQLKKVQAAVKAAEDAGAARAKLVKTETDAQNKLKNAVSEEKKKLATASKAKKDLQNDLKKAAATQKDLKKKFEKEKADVGKKEEEQKKKQSDITKKIEKADSTIKQLKTVADKTKVAKPVPTTRTDVTNA
jgi:hypothetical protein